MFKLFCAHGTSNCAVYKASRCEEALNSRCDSLWSVGEVYNGRKTACIIAFIDSFVNCRLITCQNGE